MATILAIILSLTVSGDGTASAATYWYAEPSRFVAPDVVLERLTKLGCVIPQSGASAPLQNLVAGHFVTKSRVDYAALCSGRTWSSVVVIQGQDGSVIARLSRQRDVDHVMRLEDANGVSQLFVRQLDVVKAEGQPFCLVDRDTCPCSGRTYDGIVDSYEKWSETHCWAAGWHTVTSGD